MSLFPMGKVPDTGEDRLPSRLPATPRRERTRITSFGGLDMGKSAPWGIADMVNLSPRLSPRLSTRPRRELLVPTRGLTAPHGMAMMEGTLYFAQGSCLYRIRNALASAGTGVRVEMLALLDNVDHEMTVFGNRLLIFPDKKYLVEGEDSLRPMELDTGLLEGLEFHQHTLTLPAGTTWALEGFLVGDSIYVEDGDNPEPLPFGYYRITELHGRIATISGGFDTTGTGRGSIRRVIPDMERVAVLGNRLFGYKGKDIYISAVGAPFGWQGKQTGGGGPAALRTDTDGDITACTAWQEYMLFFKKNAVCSVMGNRSDSFTLTETAIPGIPPAMARTLCEVGGELYYHGLTDVYRFVGPHQPPVCLRCPDRRVQTLGQGGTDGRGYVLDLATERENGARVWRRWIYMPEAGDWYAEDGIAPHGSLMLDGFLCTQDELGHLWLSRTDGRTLGCAGRENEVRATVTFCPDYTHEPDGYRPVGLYLRATGAEGGELRVLASFADGRFGRDSVDPLIPADEDAYAGYAAYRAPAGSAELARFAGGMQDRLLYIPLAVPHCDHMILALEMTGEWEIGAIVSEYEVVRR